MLEEANRIAQLPAFRGMTADHLAALLVGRWQSGAPVNRAAKHDIPKLGGDALANNNFRFDSDTPRFKLKGRRRDQFPSAIADRAGIACPWAAHIKDRFAAIADDRLLFLAMQSSIEEQFEFLQARWMNDPTRPKNPGGNDMIVGQNAPAENGIRRCSLFGVGLAQAQITAPAQWVIPTGGGYFFVPSISTLSSVIGEGKANFGRRRRRTNDA